MTIQQISVFLENRPGQLAEITSILSSHGIDMRALNIAETADYGVLRLITDNPEETEQVLQKNGFIVSMTNVLGIAVPDRPGGLCEILKKLADNNINVKYMYSVFGQKSGYAYMIFRVDDTEKAEGLCSEEGLATICASGLGTH